MKEKIKKEGGMLWYYVSFLEDRYFFMPKDGRKFREYKCLDLADLIKKRVAKVDDAIWILIEYRGDIGISDRGSQKRKFKEELKKGIFPGSDIIFLDNKCFLWPNKKPYENLENLAKENGLRADDALLIAIRYQRGRKFWNEYEKIQKFLEDGLSLNRLTKEQKRRLEERIKILKKIRALSTGIRELGGRVNKKEYEKK